MVKTLVGAPFPPDPEPFNANAAVRHRRSNLWSVRLPLGPASDADAYVIEDDRATGGYHWFRAHDPAYGGSGFSSIEQAGQDLLADAEATLLPEQFERVRATARRRLIVPGKV